MHRNRGLYLILFIAFTISAQSISISGKVVNKNNQPIANAVVTLAGQKINDTTDGRGAFSLSQTTFVENPGQKQLSAEKIYITNGAVRLSLVQESRVTIEMFDMRGNLLAKTPDRVAAAGEYRFDIAREPLAANMKLVRVSTGRRASTFRYFPVDKGKHSVSSALPVPSTTFNRLAKTAATIDTLKISAAGYMSRDTAISSYEAIVNVILDTMSLGKFSFFVTSLEGLQRLSGSQNGFGGDFRLGKTGQGAGLLGADSICQCLAESSMPGSKIKKWRAFLSVSQGPKD